MNVGDQDLRARLARRDYTIDELVSETAALLTALAPTQTRYKVTDRPDVRTIRYYTSQGLLPKPVGYSGGRARYSGSHLLRLLVIKKLQAEHHTLSQIARALRDRTDSDLLRVLLPVIDRMPARGTGPIPVAEPQPAPDYTAQPVQRLALAAGANLDIPQDALADPARRAELADALTELAERLRNTEDKS